VSTQYSVYCAESTACSGFYAKPTVFTLRNNPVISLMTSFNNSRVEMFLNLTRLNTFLFGPMC
jgi:hypothetical protein